MAVSTNAGVIPTSTLVHESGEYACVFPERYADLKRKIIKEEDEEAVIKAWNEILKELDKTTKEFSEIGGAAIPQIDFTEIHQLSDAKISEIRRRGCVVIRNIVDDDEVLHWKEQLRDYVGANPGVEGSPPENKQFFEIYYSKPQLEARSHPNVLEATKWLSSFWHTSGSAAFPVSLSSQLSISDRFRIRVPSDEIWTRLSPHLDGGSVQRWEDEAYRSCFAEILKGSWRSHDPFNVDPRLNARIDFYGTQVSIFRSWQGWLSMSDTGPNEGTLQLFPSLQLGISYLILRPFFRIVNPDSHIPLDSSNWVLDLTNADFPGVAVKGQGFGPIRLTKDTHPHMKIPEGLISVPKVAPGDMVFWHNDIVHAVEAEHHGKNDSSVMYIPAVPLTTQNIKYVVHQRDNFYKGLPGPFFPQGEGEANFINKGVEQDILTEEGRRAMALEKFDVKEGAASGEKEVIRFANELIAGAA